MAASMVLIIFNIQIWNYVCRFYPLKTSITYTTILINHMAVIVLLVP